MNDRDNKNFDLATVVAIAATVYCLAIGLHEAGHAIAGYAVGGNPTFLSSTDVKGDWSEVSTAGYLIIGFAGSLVNWILAAIGLGMLARKVFASSAHRYFAWLLMAVNGFMASMYMIFSPLLQFGDWMTMVRQLPAQLPLQAAILVVGIVATWGVARIAQRRLTPLIAIDAMAHRAAYAKRITRWSWLAGSAVVMAAALLSPLKLAWAVPIALGSTLGSTWPMLLVADKSGSRVDREPLEIVEPIEGSPFWIVAGSLIALVFIFFLGPGISL